MKKLKLSDVKLVYKLQAEEKEDRLKTLKRGKMYQLQKVTVYKCQNQTEMAVKMANKLTY